MAIPRDSTFSRSSRRLVPHSNKPKWVYRDIRNTSAIPVASSKYAGSRASVVSKAEDPRHLRTRQRISRFHSRRFGTNT
ncbi:hypothetical protein M408DRAFT_329343 [Serendipita vermifera MAFF 305830]|uniref:Uncharacterized protein n=1 Tax=Serendipita vermifera MAFF 305830 TaxID=933852 RepID=A0A0C3B8V9_SERVB|nr:hypothetical protein M408DRAFT_329343 [Serendipita vermifera MAFF 305830]